MASAAAYPGRGCLLWKIVRLTVSRQTFAETWKIIAGILCAKARQLSWQYRKAEDIPIKLNTLRTASPLWMGVSSLENAETAARAGMNFVSIMPPAEMRARIDRYMQVANQNGGLKPSIKMGMNVFIVVGETDTQAQKLAERAYKVWHHSFHYLYHLHGLPGSWRAGDGFEDVERRGLGTRARRNLSSIVSRRRSPSPAPTIWSGNSCSAT